MPSFTYKAVKEGGQQVTGVLTAENYLVALRLLDEQALFPIQVKEGLEQSKRAFGMRRIKLAHLTTFFSQLADLLKAGVPMLRALDVLSGKGSKGTLSQIVKELREDVAGGMSLGDAMAKHPVAFTPLQSSMVRAGEQGGFLEDVLQRIAIFLERQDELRNKVRGAMVYPSILVFFGSGVVIFLLTVVVPKLRSHLRPETFNVLTKFVFAVCDLLRDHYLGLLLGVAFVVASAVTWIKTDMGRRTFERIKLSAPILGNIITMVAICRFCRILGTLLHNGVPILQALRIAKDSAGNEILGEVIDKAAESVKKGAALSAPLNESGLFPPAILDMIAVAEESNNLETVLVQIADTNEVRTARAIDLGVRVLEPLLLLVMAVVVGCIMVALLLPILTMGTGVS
ncbi:MAG: type II secretion system F family protein [Planctomycetes bacterium]|nr:type II secretion system F family protein [Planctomycetota bacterium]MBI3834283.1 type II secretion system F family protein [Planctomycetota bacterium]